MALFIHMTPEWPPFSSLEESLLMGTDLERGGKEGRKRGVNYAPSPPPLLPPPPQTPGLCVQ